MKLALGLIETRGLVAAIEAADAMAKASNVTIVGKEKSTAALVTIKIVGEVAAVKSAIEAGAYAAGKIGELISTHIIPRPSEEIVSLIYSSKKIISDYQKENVKKKNRKNKRKATEQSFFDELAVDDNRQHNIPSTNDSQTSEDSISVLDVNQDSFKEEFADVEIEVSSEENEENNFAESSNIPKSEDKSSNVDNSDFENTDDEQIAEDNKPAYKMENLEILNVHQLRKKARDFPNFPIKGREISKANRGVLLDYFKTLL